MTAGTHISDADRRAATTVTSSGHGHKFEIQLGHLCNNRCVFCSSGQLTAMKIARAVPLEPIIEALEAARAAGAWHLTFLGGEPTTHKRFLDVLGKAVELGFEHIVIFTNGVMFPHPGFIESVLALGNFEWRISIQGANDEAHVATTERADSFKRILHGLGELQRRGQLVTANMCVNERSYRSLPDYPALLKQYGVKQLHIDIVRPESTGERDSAYLRELMPRYSDMAPYYDAMLDGFERWDPNFDVNVGNLPYCILPKWGSRIHHGGQETVTKSADATGLEDSMNKYEWHGSLRTYLPRCDDCVFRSRCTGIFRVYLQLHGEDEFQPVSPEALLALDPERRNFVLLVEPHLRALRAAIAAPDTRTLPPAWRVERESSEDRRRQVEITFLHDRGARARFVLGAPGRGRAPMITSDAYDVDVEMDPGVPEHDLATLLKWVHARLAEASNGASAPVLAAYTTSDPMLLRGRQRVTTIAKRVAAELAVPGWRVEPLRWPSESGAVLGVHGAGDARVEVRFAIGARGKKSTLGVEFHPADPNGDGVKTVIEALVETMRERPVATSPDGREAARA
jgi:sulfatase maturation enzyme AslB (radical SAM superfamily)